MAIQEIDLPLDPAVSPPSDVAKLLKEADRRIDTFFETERNKRYPDIRVRDVACPGVTSDRGVRLCLESGNRKVETDTVATGRIHTHRHRVVVRRHEAGVFAKYGDSRRGAV